MLLDMTKKPRRIIPDKRSTWAPLGNIAAAIAARLESRREEIRLNWGEKPVEPGNQGGVGPIADVGQARSHTPTRLNKGVAQTRDQGGRGECPRLGETNIIQFAARVWGTDRDRPEQSHGRPAPSVPADQFSDFAAAGPRISTTLRYQPRSGVPFGGRTAPRTGGGCNLAATAWMARVWGK